MFAHKSFLETGIPVPGASDYGPGPFEPLMAIQSMVTRKDYAGRTWGAITGTRDGFYLGFGLVFLDPPYEADLTTPTLTALGRQAAQAEAVLLGRLVAAAAQADLLPDRRSIST